VTAIWSEGSDGWELLRPAGFPDEKALQELVATAPDLLPLSGSPRVVVLGREVQLGGGFADVVAIEPSGRPVVIEVKLRNNAESRRAVVAQILAYAAALHGRSAEEFERTVTRHLAGRGLHDTVRDSAQAEVADPDEFQQTLDRALLDGALRLVLVLDQAPQELVRLVGYLEAVTHGLIIDLVTVTSYDVGGKRVVVPQRIEPDKNERPERSAGEALTTTTANTGTTVPGVDAFRERIAAIPSEYRDTAATLATWGERIVGAGLADVQTYIGRGDEVVLLPRLLPERSGLVSLYLRSDGRPAVQWWRSVFDRRAPQSVEAVEAAGGGTLGQGTMAPSVTDGLLDALYDAYVEAASNSNSAVTGPFDWTTLHDLLATVPAGRWTTYGDLAAIVGTAAQPLGGHVTRCTDCLNAWRVLGAGGRPREGFRWSDGSRSDTQQQALEAEGVNFVNGTAAGDQRISGDELSALAGGARPLLPSQTC
jgi:alkylated DNA nucleotide flippase Atl1